ncbi:unnamed protein product [Acanthoscelides obtectus]|uniref:Uncharacterized protein n=1 Tax=Acanthoscelides obtectus TaxID=200917 RepID=A0A9P0LIE6_ACAOB|nr:unnamed protein product [Acanthoscelides obtectus]CAK1627567.1 hypothetical protein AOBTE_LOCUS4666 [Acanthoscelides obtectus]
MQILCNRATAICIQLCLTMVQHVPKQILKFLAAF